jgi:hypothetical protein
LTTVGTWSKQQLAQLIARGEYRVDPALVAEAMLRRPGYGLAMFEAPKALDGPAAGIEQEQPVAGEDVA